MKPKKLPVGELLRLACLYAEQDRQTPTAWYHPTAAGGPVPCRWEGWADLGPTRGRVWLVASSIPG